MNFDLTSKVLLLASAKYSWDFTKLKFIQQNCSTTRPTMHRGCAAKTFQLHSRDERAESSGRYDGSF